jgi:branched-chain amino acid transport system substrate-binding protein
MQPEQTKKLAKLMLIKKKLPAGPILSLMGKKRGKEMSKKVLAAIIVTAAIIVILSGAYLASRPANQAPKTIKIGWPTPLTGPIANFGESDPWLAKHFTKIVNDERGGVYLREYGKRIPIEILIRDTGSDEKTATIVAENLILDDKADLMLTLHTPGTTVPVSLTCEKYKVPCIAANTPVISWLSGGPYEWSYLHFWTEIDASEVYVNMWSLVKTNKKVGGLWNDDADGKTFREATMAAAQEQGYDFIGDAGLSSYGTKDYSAYITGWMEKDVEIIAGNFIPPDFASLLRQMREMGFNPKVITVGRAILFPSAVSELGSHLPLGLTTEVWASRHHPYVSSMTGFTPERLETLWEEESGKQSSQPLFYSYAMLEVALDTLERAGSIDKEKIRNALADTDLDTIVGHVSYKAALSPEDEKRYEKYPQLIKNKDHYSIAPVVGGQWARGAKWPWEIQIVHNWNYGSIPQTSEMIVIPKGQ